ncbi:hypothetical protein OD91_0885 [Lutibacter sp. Hel_I_33_5]|uniref:hypothetical protein n=1 Tax=Lutibacter sp. Hel_I_33_5 TaxID=1566289 RepID=UPI0011AD32C9|nr:hypothetical protein [Lutibacter sp. Hel_I_33_5]TVZ55630.1 hypothetical protein OD91_0885 [Lutibacter sp. Hel_I_33_5]
MVEIKEKKLLTLDSSLADKIREKAVKENRSFSNMVVTILINSFKDDKATYKTRK